MRVTTTGRRTRVTRSEKSRYFHLEKTQDAMTMTMTKTKRKRVKIRKPLRDGYKSRWHKLLNLKKKGDAVEFPRRNLKTEKERFQIYAMAKYWLGPNNVSVYKAGSKKFKVVLRRGR